MRVKVCGLTSPDAARQAVEAGAAYIGLVFFDASPRAVSIEAASQIATAVPPGIARVALTVDPNDALIEAIRALPIDMIQLHGHETPDRVRQIKALTGLPVMKAVGVRDQDDLAEITRFAGVADQLLIDAKPPRGSVLPGGNGLTFDWRLIAGRRWPCPWMLAGGLNAGNVAEAVRLSGATQIDVSSGVESAPGVKDPALVKRFIESASL